MSIKIENVNVFGWEAAIRGARNPMNSWDKSDSWFIKEYVDNGRRVDAHQINPSYTNYDCMKNIELRDQIDAELKYANDNAINGVFIGLNDHKLLTNLCKGGTEESKWRRMVHVQMDVTAPLYWWKEFDTYKVGTVSNSCSTMHKIHAKEFTLEDFSCEHLFRAPDFKDIPDFENDEDIKQYKEQVDEALKLMREGKEHVWPESIESAAEREARWHYDNGAYYAAINCDINGDMSEWAEANYALDVLNTTIDALNYYREKYLKTKDKRYWLQMIQLLPSSYNQKRTIDLNYEVLAAQYRQRKDHKLDCWHQYCDWIRSLPYSEFITMEEIHDKTV